MAYKETCTLILTSATAERFCSNLELFNCRRKNIGQFNINFV